MPEDILTFPRRCRQTEYSAKVEEFRGYFHEAFERCLYGSHAKPFPYAKVLGDVVLRRQFGCTLFAVKNPVGSNGDVGTGQYRRLKQLLEAPELRRKRRSC